MTSLLTDFWSHFPTLVQRRAVLVASAEEEKEGTGKKSGPWKPCRKGTEPPPLCSHGPLAHGRGAQSALACRVQAAVVGWRGTVTDGERTHLFQVRSGFCLPGPALRQTRPRHTNVTCFVLQEGE